MTKRIEYRTVDKSTWGTGEWQSEPDKAQWQDERTGFPCLIVRGPVGALCGYVGLPPGHKWHGVGYDSVPVDCHGGLTFAHGCGHGANAATGICHIPAAGESDNVWWLGFDCAHCGDFSPATVAVLGDRYMTGGGERYRDWAYVQEQVESLALQLMNGE